MCLLTNLPSHLLHFFVRVCLHCRHLEAAQKAGEGKSGGSVPIGSPSRAGGGAHAILAEGFTQEDRERVLELLLSQERVVSLLYAKTFPVNTKQAGGLSLEDGAIPQSMGIDALGLSIGLSGAGGNDVTHMSRPATTGGAQSHRPHLLGGLTDPMEGPGSA